MAGSSTQSVDSSKELAFHSSTTNLRENLMNRHSSCYKDDGAKKERQGTLQLFARPKHCSEARAKEITDHIANFVAQDMTPVHVIEGNFKCLNSLKVTEMKV